MYQYRNQLTVQIEFVSLGSGTNLETKKNRNKILNKILPIATGVIYLLELAAVVDDV